MFAVVKTGGKQYRVAKDGVIVVEKLAGDKGAKVTFDQVLMTGDGKSLKLGKDLGGVTVTGELVETKRATRSRCSRSAAATLSPQDRSPSRPESREDHRHRRQEELKRASWLTRKRAGSASRNGRDSRRSSLSA